MGTRTGTRPSWPGADRIHVPAIVLASLLLVSPGLAATHRHHPAKRGWNDGVVRCVALSAPSHHRPAAVARGRVALPTDRAVFFARSGDRCLWHHGVLGRG